MASKKEKSPEELGAWLRIVTAITRFVDRFGMAVGMIVLLLFTVWFMGSDKTQDDFVRELLFGEVTKTRHLAMFFVALVAISLFGLDGIIRARLLDSREVKRLAAERDKWQARALDEPALDRKKDDVDGGKK